MQGRIESLQREFDFVSKLTTDEVTFIMDKKKEHAARSIQRVVKRRQAAQKRERIRAEMKANAGMTTEDLSLLLAYIPEDLLKKRQADLKKLKESVEEKFGTNTMRFYDKPIDEERRNELKD